MGKRTSRDAVITNLKITLPNGEKTRVIQRIYEGDNFTRKDISETINDLKKQYAHKNLRVMVSVVIPEHNEHRSGKSFNLQNDKPVYPDDYEWETTPNFIIYIWQDKPKAGGNDEYNDCLYHSIVHVYTSYRLPKDMKTPSMFKEKLNLKRDDKIDIRYMPTIEKLLKININISGDYVYTSKHTFDATVNILLSSGHYSFIKNEKSALLNTLPKMEQQLIICQIENDNVKCYDGSFQYIIPIQEFKKQKYEINNQSYITIGNNNNIVEYYNQYIQNVHLVRDLSHNKYDLSKSGYLPKNESLKSIHYALQCFDKGEPLNGNEEYFIKNSFKGGIRFIRDDIELLNGYDYDIRGSYASILSSSSFTFPIHQGIFQSIDALPDILPYGIYRCIVHEGDDFKKNKLFKFNEFNYYTHYDIHSARLLEFNIELIHDDEANCLLYQKNRKNGHTYFGGLVYELNELKKKVSTVDKSNTLVKETMAALWGSLCTRNKKYVSLHKEVVLKEDADIIDFRDNCVAYTRRGKFYKYNYARIGTFLTAYARLKMVKDTLPIFDNVYRIYTDSILSNIPLDSHIDVGENLGQYKMNDNNGKKITVFKNGRRPIWS